MKSLADLIDAVCVLVSIAAEQLTRDYFEELDNCGAAIIDCLERLEHYEELEKQGSLLKLPCKVGDTVYKLWYADGIPYKVNPVKIRSLDNVVAMMEDGAFGRTVFLTEEEAEKALAEREKLQ